MIRLVNRDHWGQVAILETKSKTSISWFLSLRPSPRLEFSEFQFQDRVREWKFLSLNFETKSKNKDFTALTSAFLWEKAWTLPCSLAAFSETKIWRPILDFSLPQFQDWVRLWNFVGHSLKIKTGFSETQCQDQVWDTNYLMLNFKTKTKTMESVATKSLVKVLKFITKSKAEHVQP